MQIVTNESRHCTLYAEDCERLVRSSRIAVDIRVEGVWIKFRIPEAIEPFKTAADLEANVKLIRRRLELITWFYRDLKEACPNHEPPSMWQYTIDTDVLRDMENGINHGDKG